MIEHVIDKKLPTFTSNIFTFLIWNEIKIRFLFVYILFLSEYPCGLLIRSHGATGNDEITEEEDLAYFFVWFPKLITATSYDFS